VTDQDVHGRSTALRQAAADELAERLKGLAVRLADTGVRPKRVWFGRGYLKRLSPVGFVLEPLGPQLLLPDGRLWSYHSRGNPRGRFFDPRVDHAACAHGPLSLGGRDFVFLGVVVHGYSFGYLHHDGVDYSPDHVDLCAIAGHSTPPRFARPDDAFADIADKL